jgi:hypothetical protein
MLVFVQGYETTGGGEAHVIPLEDPFVGHPFYTYSQCGISNMVP